MKTGRIYFSPTKSENKSYIQKDEGLAVATITRVCDELAAIYYNSAPPDCQSQRIEEVNNKLSTRATNTQQKNVSKLLSALYSRTTQLLKSHSANTAHIH